MYTCEATRYVINTAFLGVGAPPNPPSLPPLPSSHCSTAALPTSALSHSNLAAERLHYNLHSRYVKPCALWVHRDQTESCISRREVYVHTGSIRRERCHAHGPWYNHTSVTDCR
jgi:hypothetical protein